MPAHIHHYIIHNLERIDCKLKENWTCAGSCIFRWEHTYVVSMRAKWCITMKDFPIQVEEASWLHFGVPGTYRHMITSSTIRFLRWIVYSDSIFKGYLAISPSPNMSQGLKVGKRTPSSPSLKRIPSTAPIQAIRGTYSTPFSIWENRCRTESSGNRLRLQCGPQWSARLRNQLF